MKQERRKVVNARRCTGKLRVDGAHVGLYDVEEHTLWVPKKRWGSAASAIRASHASLLTAGKVNVSTADKDRFLCFWFYPPDAGSGYVLGYPIDWGEGHVMVRLDPEWNHVTGSLVASTDTAKTRRNIDQQYEWGERIFRSYLDLKPGFALSWHMIGPRARDSMFYIERVERGT